MFHPNLGSWGSAYMLFSLAACVLSLGARIYNMFTHKEVCIHQAIIVFPVDKQEDLSGVGGRCGN